MDTISDTNHKPLTTPGRTSHFGEFTAPNATTIFKYNPHMTPIERVMATFTGRDDLLEQMVAHLRSQRHVDKPYIFSSTAPAESARPPCSLPWLTKLLKAPA